MSQMMTDDKKMGNTNLLGEDLAVVPSAVEDNIAIVIYWVTCSNHAKHLKWPLQ